MSRFPRMLLACALFLLVAGAGLGILIAAPPADAQVLSNVGTPTLPPTPSPEPPTATGAPTAAVPPTSTATTAPPTSTATAVPATSTSTAIASTSTPAPPTSTATTAPPTGTAAPTGTPVRPTLTLTATEPPPTASPDSPRRDPPTSTAIPATQTAAQPTEPSGLDLELAKQVDRSEVAQGEQLLYTLAVRNLSAQAAADVRVSDTLPEQIVALSARSDRARVEFSDRQVTAWVPLLAPGELVEIQIAARVRTDAPAGELLNTARVTSSAPGDPPGNNTSSVAVRVRERAIERLPRTAYAPDLPLMAVPPLVWAALVGGLLFTLGGALSWGLRGWMRRPRAQREPGLRPIGTSRAFQLPAPPPAGPARLGAPLPPPQPPAPLPPLARLDRDDALRDVLGDEEECGSA